MNVFMAQYAKLRMRTLGPWAPDWRMRTRKIPQYEQQQWVVQVSQSSQQSHTQLSVFPPFSLN